MKMRKVLSFVLILALVLGSFSMAFAATDNQVTNVKTYAKEANINASLELRVTNSTLNWATEQVLKITLENADWANDDIATDVDATVNFVNGTTEAAIVSKLAKNTIKLELPTSGGALNLAKDDVIVLDLDLEAGKTIGEVKVKIEGIDSDITGGTFVVGIIGDGATTAKVEDDPELIGERATAVAADIEIMENSIGAVDTGETQKIKLTLPKDFEWVAVTASGIMSTTNNVAGNIQADARDVEITFTSKANASRGFLTIESEIRSLKGAKDGDVSVQLRVLEGDISKASNLVIATKAAEAVKVYTDDAEDLPTIVSGWETDRLDGGNYELKVYIDETVAKALTAGRYIDFTFPEWVQLAGDVSVDGATNAGFTPDGKDIYDDTSSFEWLVAGVSDSDVDELEFTIPVTVEAGHAGDLEVVVSGAKAGVEETKLVVAKIIDPITVEVKEAAKLKLGVQDQVAPVLVLKETEAGLWQDGSEIVLGSELLGTLFNGKGADIDWGDIKVTAGDMEIKVAKDGNSFEIDRESIKDAAEITISGGTVDMLRWAAEGGYDALISGDAIIDNGIYFDNDGTDPSVGDGEFADSYDVEAFVVITPADTAANATFVIGEASYTLNGVKVAMDAASYIDENGRTMVPVRYVANALGVPDGSIVWNANSKTAIIMGKNVVSVKMGENFLLSNGIQVPMDTTALIKDDRFYVPARYIALALGAEVAWNADTRTVNIYTVAN